MKPSKPSSQESRDFNHGSVNLPASTPGGYNDLYTQLTAALETGGGRR